MSGRPPVLVVQHEDDCPVGFIQPWLARAGLESDVLQAHRGRAVPTELVDHSALVVLGGHMGAGDDADHPWLLPTKALIATTVASGRPFLGVCLGHQLATVALGGRVTPNPHGPSRSLLPLGVTSEGVRDALLSAVPAGAPVLHWNNDVTVELPATSVELATSPDGTVQAARFGPHAWGVQFHPEVDVEIVRRWARGEDPEAERTALDALVDRRGELHQVWEALVSRFGQVALAA
jgi:GMP synthase (glutamine-hydrolysing)